MQCGARVASQARLQATLRDLALLLVDGQTRIEEILHEIAGSPEPALDGRACRVKENHSKEPAKERVHSWDEHSNKEELPTHEGDVPADGYTAGVPGSGSLSHGPKLSMLSRRACTSKAMDMIHHDPMHSCDVRKMMHGVVYPSRSGSFFGARLTPPFFGGRLSPTSKMTSSAETNTFASVRRLKARALVTSAPYEMFSMFMILLNTIFIAWQTQHHAMNRQVLPWQVEAQIVFCLVFVLELTLKAYAMASEFLFGDARGWNVFDLIVVALMLVETLVMAISHASSTFQVELPHVSTLRALRALRVVRLLRATRNLEWFSQLRIMIRSIMHSVKPLAWASVVLVFMFFLFGMTLTQGTVDYLHERNAWDQEDSSMLRSRFGTIQLSVLSLFQVMSGGQDWGPLYDTLAPIGFKFQFVLLFFVLFAIFGAANVMTGIFVEIANEWTRNDREMQVQQELDKKLSYVKAMQNLFSELDPDCTGMLTLDNFQGILDDQRLMHSFAALKLELMDVKSLFLLLDRDQKGFIDVEEFLLGCLRLKGDAKQLDVMKLQYQSEWIMHNVTSIQDLLGVLTSKFGIDGSSYHPEQPVSIWSSTDSRSGSMARRCVDETISNHKRQCASNWMRETAQTMSARQWQAALSRRATYQSQDRLSVKLAVDGSLTAHSSP